MNNSVNREERRLEQVEERMAGFGAPEPPADLLAKIQAEIPVVLVAEDRGAGDGPSGSRGHRWRLLAASLAMVSLAGLFGYRLLREELTLEETIDRGSEAAAPGRVVELGEARYGSTVESGIELPDDSKVEREIEVIGPAVGEPTVGKDSGKEEMSVALPESRVSRVDSPDVGRNEQITVAGAEGETKLDEVSPTEIGEPNRNENEVSKPLVVESLTVTAETPLLDVNRTTAGTPVDLDRVPKASRFEVPSSDSVRSLIVGGSSGTESADVELKALRRRASALQSRLGKLVEPTDRLRRPTPKREAVSDMFFQDYGTNPFVDTDEDPLSTFGIDVDTAAYTVARSYLERGLLPPPAAVRVEEFVNYFDYGDPAPRSRDFAVVVEGAPSPFSGAEAGSHLLRFALKGREVTAAERKPAVLTFVIDVSGSMEREDRLELVKRALRLLVRQLDDRDAIGLVIYGSHGELLLEPTSDHRRVLRAIESLRPGGSTNAEEGLVLGYRTARNAFRPGAINRVILCSDGVANVGRTGPEAILRRIGDEAASGIELTTVGFGMDNFNDVLMEQLADQGDGNYAYVDDVSAARRVFVENLTGTLETIAGDAKIQVEFNPAVVASYRLLGYENRDIADRDFRNDAVDAGEIGAGHQVTALYEVNLRQGEAQSSEPVATLRLRYRSKRSGRMVEDAIDLERDDLAWSWRAGSTQLRLASIVAEFAEQLRGAPRAAAVDLDRLSQLARDLVGRVGARDDVAELAALIETAARLRESTGRPSRGDGFER